MLIKNLQYKATQKHSYRTADTLTDLVTQVT